MKQYLSNIKSVRLISKNRIQKLARQASQIYIDDGANTLIDMKGDGVKSLLAISVLHNAVRNKEKSDLFIGIEEPESHLHPKAIHRLKDVIYELAKNNQIIISTHSPIFVDRQNIKNNIIVNSKTASPAKNINEIRDSLGVLISDNLQSAGHVLLVEGEGDVRCIKTFLNGNKITKRALSKGELMIKALVGVSNLSYQLKHYQEVLCKVYVFIDNDDEGRAAYQKASELNLISTKDIFFTNFPGRSNSEFEDLIMPSIYKDAVYQELGILLQGDKFQDYRSKWSDRVKNVYHGSGKPWNEGIKAEIKNIVCTQIERMGISALLKQGEAPILSLINHLKNQLKTTT